MEKGWYKYSQLKLQIEQARIWATQMGYQGEEHQDMVRTLILTGMEDID